MSELVQCTPLDQLTVLNQGRHLYENVKYCEDKREFYLNEGLVPWSIVTKWDSLIEERETMPGDKKL